MLHSNTNELKKALQTIFSKYATAYYESAISSAFPYIVYDLRETTIADGRTNFAMEVNIVCKNSNAEADNIADTIQDELDHLYYQNENISFSVYRQSRQAVVEEDKSIKRRRMMFDLSYYSKS